MFKPSTFTRLATIAGALFLAATATGCQLGDAGGPMMTPTTGSIDATGVFAGYSGTFCTDDSTWTFTALSLDGSEGESGPVVHTHRNLPPTLSTNNECRSRDLATYLRLGTWRVSWLGHSCDLDIRKVQWVIIEQNGNCRTHL